MAGQCDASHRALKWKSRESEGVENDWSATAIAIDRSRDVARAHWTSALEGGDSGRSMATAGAAGGRITAGAGLNLLGQHGADRNAEATVYVGNLDAQVTEEVLWELFLQAGPVTNVYVPKDRVTSSHQGYGFVEYRTEEDADYGIKILNMVKLFGKPIKVNKSAGDRRDEVGANLFIGNLDPDIDEKLLYDTFSAFGVVINTPKIMRDVDNGVSKGFGFVAYDSFDASDAAIEAMNGQFLCNKQINVQYAFKKDSKGERHGTQAERLLAQSIERPKTARPHTLFSAGPASTPTALGGGMVGIPPPPPGMMMGGVPPPPGMMMGGIPPPPPPGMMGYSVMHAPLGGLPPGAVMPPPPAMILGGIAPLGMMSVPPPPPPPPH